MSDQNTQLSSDQQLYELRMRADNAVQALQFHGFVRCDIAACNCGSWHPRYGLPERFREIEDALTEADINLNGKTLLTVIKELIKDAVRLNSNTIRIQDRDEFGEPTACIHIGLDLRKAIDEAMEDAKP